jgi:hypothetical protein
VVIPNDRAVMRELLTMDDYFNSRFVSSRFGSTTATIR